MCACDLCKEEFGLHFLGQRAGYCALCGRVSRYVVDSAKGNLRYQMRLAKTAAKRVVSVVGSIGELVHEYSD